MDGPAYITQEPIENGHVYRYEFTAVQSGTYFIIHTIMSTGSRGLACMARC
jgi:Multicopper oxidase